MLMFVNAPVLEVDIDASPEAAAETAVVDRDVVERGVVELLEVQALAAVVIELAVFDQDVGKLRLVIGNCGVGENRDAELIAVELAVQDVEANHRSGGGDPQSDDVAREGYIIEQQVGAADVNADVRGDRPARAES